MERRRHTPSSERPPRICYTSSQPFVKDELVCALLLLSGAFTSTPLPISARESREEDCKGLELYGSVSDTVALSTSLDRPSPTHREQSRQQIHQLHLVEHIPTRINRHIRKERHQNGESLVNLASLLVNSRE